jgi:hypothetical protein
MAPTELSENSWKAPALIARSAKELLLAWTGTDDHHSLNFVSSGNGTDFHNKSVLDERSPCGPALATNGTGTAWLAWVGDDKDHHLNVAKTDDAKHLGQKVVLDHFSDFPPAIVYGDGVLYLAWTANNAGTRVNVVQSSDEGRTWDHKAILEQALFGGPALAFADSVLYIAWAAADGFVHAASSKDGGSTFVHNAQLPGAITTGTVSLAYFDGNLTAAWRGSQVEDRQLYTVSSASGPHPAGGVVGEGSWDYTMQLSDTSNREPALAVFEEDLWIAWAGESDDRIYIDKLASLKFRVSFQIDKIHISNMRSGHASIKDGQDTDFVSINLAVNGVAAHPANSLPIGNQTGGDVEINYSNWANVQDSDWVMINYSILNTGSGDSTAYNILKEIGDKILTAVVKADEAAITEFEGLGLVSLTPKESAILIGAQVGAIVGGYVGWPEVGAIIGAIGGLFEQTIGEWITPDCDGPVAAGFWLYSGKHLRGLLSAGGAGGVQDNPGTNSAGGCGSNSDYQVHWVLRS